MNLTVKIEKIIIVTVKQKNDFNPQEQKVNLKKTAMESNVRMAATTALDPACKYFFFFLNKRGQQPYNI